MINNYESFISHINNHRTCKLRTLIHVFAYNKNKDWKFEQEIPENFCFTFHPLWWRYYVDFDSKNSTRKTIRIFFEIYPYLFVDKKVIGSEIENDYHNLNRIYNNSTSYNFKITKDDFIKAYTSWLKVTKYHIFTTIIKPNSEPNITDLINYKYIPLEPRTDEELEELYNKAKKFYEILNEFEEFLFNLSDWELSKLDARAKGKKSAEFFPIKKITKRNCIYSYHKGLINQLMVKKSEVSDAYFDGTEVEFDTQKVINHFQNKEGEFLPKEEGKSGAQDEFDNNDRLAWKHLFEKFDIEFQDTIFPGNTLVMDKRGYYANLYKQWFNNLTSSNRKEFTTNKIRNILRNYYINNKDSYYVKRNEKLPKNKIRDHFIALIEGKKKKNPHKPSSN